MKHTRSYMIRGEQQPLTPRQVYEFLESLHGEGVDLDKAEFYAYQDKNTTAGVWKVIIEEHHDG